jgi:hypothetical protein
MVAANQSIGRWWRIQNEWSLEPSRFLCQLTQEMEPFPIDLTVMFPELEHRASVMYFMCAV